MLLLVAALFASVSTGSGLLDRQSTPTLAIALSLPLRDAGEDQPVLRVTGDPMRVEQLLLDLAERFGVSTSFIEYRLARYALAGR